MPKNKAIAEQPIHIEAVYFTPGRDPVHVHYAGKGVTSGPLSTSTIFHTTQSKLAGVEPSEDAAWGDDEVVSALEDHLAENGINAKVVLPEPEPPAEEVEEVVAG